MRRLLRFLTGGRPMVRGDFILRDAVSGRYIYEFTDAYGRKWMTHSAWAWFRVSMDDVERDMEALRIRLFLEDQE